MSFYNERTLQRWIILITALVFIGLILFNASLFFQQLKQDERTKMKIWTLALEEAVSYDIDNPNSGADLEFVQQVLSNNTTTPSINTDDSGFILGSNNIAKEDENDPEKMQDYLKKMKSENKPITIDIGEGDIQYVYYGNSPTLNKLKYYPFGLIIFILLLVAVVYFFYKTSKSSEQNKLWAGMAKETAHQIGTPLSSLVGWTEILKAENVNPSYIEEIEKDIDRLNVITDRFSKIGSKPKLETTDIVQSTKDTFDYLKQRSSRLIEFEGVFPEQSIFVNLNKPLYSWTIENLVKNAIDAMKGKGKLSVKVLDNEKSVKIYVEDSGNGIPKGKFKRIFEPGYTSKKRGWGLGLSFAKRIIEDYHTGRIKVLKSEPDKGTTFEIKMKKEL